MNLTLIFAFLFSLQAQTPSEVKEETIEDHLRKVVLAEVNKECRNCRIDMQIHNAKILHDIAKPDAVIAEHWKGQTNLILKLGEDSRIVTATIRWMDDVVVVNKNTKQGHLFKESDLRVVEKDVTYLKTAYASSVDLVKGLETQRVFQRGQVVDETLLKKPIVVRYGETIRLQLNDGALVLEMTGQAKGAGAIGDRIPVSILETKKNLFAVIVEKGTARVE